MGITKSEMFDRGQNQIADFAKALAHPARVAILQHLVEQRDCMCGELVDALPFRNRQFRNI